MRKKNGVLIILLIFLLVGFGDPTASNKKPGESPVLKGASQGQYLGQEPPGMKPVAFALGIVSTPVHEYSITISKDGREIFFTRLAGKLSHIFFSKYQGGKWTPPEIAPFSGKFNDYDQSFSPGGDKLFFTSDRPVTGSNWIGDIWVVTRSGSGWTRPKPLSDTINTKVNEAYPSLTTRGTLYFHAVYSPKDHCDIYRSEFVNGKYCKPEALGPGVNSANSEYDAFIAPDEKFIIFVRPDEGFGEGDLFISFRKDDRWTRAVNMGPAVNTSAREYCPGVSPDGKYLFFTRFDRVKRIRGEIYWVSAKIIESLRPN
jgi:hypothetical protein